MTLDVVCIVVVGDVVATEVSLAFNVVTVLGATVEEGTRVGATVTDSDATDVVDGTSVVIASPLVFTVVDGTLVLVAVITRVVLAVTVTLVVGTEVITTLVDGTSVIDWVCTIVLVTLASTVVVSDGTFETVVDGYV